jgi:hypothetical protein
VKILIKEVSVELPDGLNNGNSLRRGLRRTSYHVLPLPMSAVLLVFTVIVRLLVFQVTMELERGRLE